MCRAPRVNLKMIVQSSEYLDIATTVCVYVNLSNASHRLQEPKILTRSASTPPPRPHVPGPSGKTFLTKTWRSHPHPPMPGVLADRDSLRSGHGLFFADPLKGISDIELPLLTNRRGNRSRFPRNRHIRWLPSIALVETRPATS